MLQSLAVADTAVLSNGLLLRSFRYLFFTDYTYRYVFICMFPMNFAVRLIQTWLVVLLTVDRYIAVSHPLHAQRLASVSRTKLIITVLCITSMLLSLPRFFEYQLVPIDPLHSTGFTATSLMADPVYSVAYCIVLFSVVMYLTPMAVLTILNVRLLLALRESQAYQARTVLHFARRRGDRDTGNGVSAKASANWSEPPSALERGCCDGSVEQCNVVAKTNG